MKKAILTLLTVSALTLGAHAVQITGTIDFAGQAYFDTTSLATATSVVNFKIDANSANNTAMVTDATGDFSSIAAGTTASFPNVYTFNPSSPVTPLWTVGGFTFDLTSSTIVNQNAFSLVVRGIGTLSGNGFEATPGAWILSSGAAMGQNQTSFSFQANTTAVPTVPDGGSTVALLGAVLVGMVAFRQKLRAV